MEGSPSATPSAEVPLWFWGMAAAARERNPLFPMAISPGLQEEKIKKEKFFFKKRRVEVHGSLGVGVLARSATSAGGTKQCSLSPPQHLSLGCRQIDLQRLRLAAQPALHSQRSAATQ